MFGSCVSLAGSATWRMEERLDLTGTWYCSFDGIPSPKLTWNPKDPLQKRVYVGTLPGFHGVLEVYKVNWVAVKELELSYYIGETLLFTIYIPIMVT